MNSAEPSARGASPSRRSPVLTARARRPTDARRFLLVAVGASLGVFGVLRLAWTEAHVVLPLTRIQAGLAVALFGEPTMQVRATLACSGVDALALCLGAVLAYPVTWQTRLRGAVGATALILALNVVRIGTLGRVAGSPAWFNTLHVHVWPALLTLAAVGYVFTWMSVVDRWPPPDGVAPAPRGRAPTGWPLSSRRFVVLGAVLLLLFVAASPLYLDSAGVLAVAGVIARAAASMLGLVGVSAHAESNVFWTSHGGVLVTQECIATPLIPIYLAAVCAFSTTWRRLILGILATLPLFIALGVLRLMVVAVPTLAVSPVLMAHAFYQVLAGTALVCLAARWQYRGWVAVGHALAGVIVGVLFVQWLGPSYTHAIAFQTGSPLDDPQGAVALLPAFQVGLYLALWLAASRAVDWRHALVGMVVLAFTQTAGLFVLHALATGHGLSAHPRDIRGWAVVGPALIIATVIHVVRARH